VRIPEGDSRWKKIGTGLKREKKMEMDKQGAIEVEGANRENANGRKEGEENCLAWLRLASYG
jgi:hypothetical protein